MDSINIFKYIIQILIVNILKQINSIKMGSQISSFAQSNNLSIPENCKLYSVLPINAPSQQQQMTQILQKRIKLSQCPYICTIKGYDFLAQQSNRLSCTQDKKLVVYYDYFDYRLIDVTIKNYIKEFNQGQLCFIIKCITQALAYLKKFKLHHGDVSFQNICRKGKGWKLIDKIFLKNGINAYEKVLQGETGFISPKHMMRIRHGFIKQSPEICQQDDIFSLGMVMLQLASGVPSALCYKQLNVRFNDEIINNNIQICRKKYSEEFMRIVQGMINFEQEERIGIEAILNQPLIQGKTLFINQHNNLNSIHNVINQAPDTRQAVHFKNSAESSHISYSKTNLIPSNKNYNQQSRKPYTPGSTTVRLIEKHQNDGQLNSNTPRATVGSFKGSQFSQPVHNGKEHMLTRVINPNGTGQTIKAPYYQKFVTLPNSISQPYHNGNVQEGNISNMGGQRLKTIN